MQTPEWALHFNRTRTFKSEMYALLCALSPRCSVLASPSRKPCSQPRACSGRCSILSAELASSVPSVLLTVTVSLWSAVSGMLNVLSKCLLKRVMFLVLGQYLGLHGKRSGLAM